MSHPTEFAGEYKAPTVEEIVRPEGYKEFRCVPAHWIPAPGHDLAPYVVEALSTLMGLEKDPDFWSASDAAMRARNIAPAALDERELAILATRRSNDYNRAGPWASSKVALGLEKQWGGESDPHVHAFANLPREESDGLFGHYGASATRRVHGRKPQVVTGMGMRDSQRPMSQHEPWRGGIGAWLSWQTVHGWQIMPRRQDVLADLVEDPSEGQLLLFISHRWASVEHPDPTGTQLQALKTGLTLALCAAIVGIDREHATSSGLPEIIERFVHSCDELASKRTPLLAWALTIIGLAKEATNEAAFLAATEAEEKRLGAGPGLDWMRSRILLWYDYASMYQSPRTVAEESSFRQELQTLNRIQGSAATVVISDNDDYLNRAWCFLEIAGGIRGAITELTPSWSQSLDIYEESNRWTHITDQLIGALNMWGPEAISSSGLAATHSSDLPIVAGLIAELPLIGLVETDGMDLIGGSIPIFFIDGEGWVIADGANPNVKETSHQLHPFADYGRVLPRHQLSRAANEAIADKLAGECGMWVYASQRALALSWLERRGELHAWLRAGLGVVPQLDAACATWADSRCLAEDGKGWTRLVPSSVKTLIIVTQADLPKICLLNDMVLRSHLAAGCTVITVAPELGTVKVEVPAARVGGAVRANVLAAPRIRRSTAYPAYLLLNPGASAELLKRAAWLRLQPAELAEAAVPLSSDEFAALSKDRVLAEAECRTTAASWEALLVRGLDPLTWRAASEAREQIDIVRQILSMLRAFTTNPLVRRQLLYAILQNDTEEGSPLPAHLPRRVAEILEGLRAEGEPRQEQPAPETPTAGNRWRGIKTKLQATVKGLLPK